jgi:hypothetical protein
LQNCTNSIAVQGVAPRRQSYRPASLPTEVVVNDVSPTTSEDREIYFKPALQNDLFRKNRMKNCFLATVT